jgi:hypothetical protein
VYARPVDPRERSVRVGALGTVVQEMIPRASHYFVTTFVYAQPSKPNTTLHLPILRDESSRRSRSFRRSRGRVLQQQGRPHGAHSEPGRGRVPCRVYGMRVSQEMHSSNVTICPFSDEGFIHDLATARASSAGQASR